MSPDRMPEGWASKEGSIKIQVHGLLIHTCTNAVFVVEQERLKSRNISFWLGPEDSHSRWTRGFPNFLWQ
jgi:hypothetical protein